MRSFTSTSFSETTESVLDPETADEFDEKSIMANYASEWVAPLSRDDMLSLSVLLQHVFSFNITEAAGKAIGRSDRTVREWRVTVMDHKKELMLMDTSNLTQSNIKISSQILCTRFSKNALTPEAPESLPPDLECPSDEQMARLFYSSMMDDDQMKFWGTRIRLYSRIEEHGLRDNGI